ncbi:hypothetical protein [Psychroserpens algicola]|uniref:OmpA family protein n=1 Tax=Psychroserpens algicola TaxID=1719034 RepID=A0ABT0HD04_9FLAO|nr:hypothetical protein [Psychroserpens algicola]MCK8481702.1 hypothetical protein [Psychroserpens algicola]
MIAITKKKMDLKKVTLILLLTLHLISCNSKVNSEKNKSDEPNRVQVENGFWSDSNRKYLKIDSTEFEVVAEKNRLTITMEKEASFDSQMSKLRTVINSIKHKTDINELKSVFIWAGNNELLSNISKVPEIQAELKRSEIENGIVNSMGIVSKHAYKANLLKEITDLFSEFDLSPYRYYIDKCHVDKRKNNSKNYEIACASIVFKFKKKST